MSMRDNNIERVSIIPFLWSILCASVNHYLYCLCFTFVAMILTYFAVRIIFCKITGNVKLHTNKCYLSLLFVINIIFLLLNIAIFQDVCSFIILLSLCFILNIIMIFILDKRRKELWFSNVWILKRYSYIQYLVPLFGVRVS